MATFTVRIMEDGPRNAVLLVNGDNGGTPAGGTDLATTPIILPSQLGFVNQATGQRASSLRVDTIEWDVQAEVQMQVNLFWDATVPVEFYSCIGRANKYFKNFGGLYQQAGIAGSTGGISMNTVGTSATLNNKWTIVLYLVKLLNPA